LTFNVLFVQTILKLELPITEQGGTGTTVYFPGANDVSLLEIMLLFK
jgi:hypothetical protein